MALPPCFIAVLPFCILLCRRSAIWPGCGVTVCTLIKHTLLCKRSALGLKCVPAACRSAWMISCLQNFRDQGEVGGCFAMRRGSNDEERAPMHLPAPGTAGCNS